MTENIWAFSAASSTETAQRQAATEKKDRDTGPKTFTAPVSSFVPRPVQNVKVEIDKKKLAKALKELG